MLASKCLELCEAGSRRCSIVTKKRKLTGEALRELKRTTAQGKGRQGVIFFFGLGEQRKLFSKSRNPDDFWWRL